MKKELWAYDIEQFPNFHSCYFINIDSDEHVFFIVHEALDQRKEYYEFLRDRVSGLIGFNNLHYDSKMLNCFIENINNPRLLNLLYKRSKLIISDDDKWESPIIHQLDLFKIHHYNNKAKMTSLKWIEFYLRMEDVMDLDISFDSPVEQYQFEDIIYYNRNDVIATKKFYEYTINKGMIELRKDIGKEFGFNAINLNDVSIGERINAIYYSKFSGLNFFDYREGRTPREEIRLVDCIPEYVSFKTPILTELLEDLKEKVISGTKNQMSFKVKLANKVYYLKNGGIHSDDAPRLIKPTKDQILLEIDVGLNWAN